MDIIANYPEPDGSINNQHYGVVVFQLDEYRAEIKVSVGGNCYGWDIFDAFFSDALDKCATDESGEYFSIQMKTPEGKETSFEGEERDFGKICVGIFITRIVPEKHA